MDRSMVNHIVTNVDFSFMILPRIPPYILGLDLTYDNVVRYTEEMLSDNKYNRGRQSVLCWLFNRAITMYPENKDMVLDYAFETFKRF